MEVPIFIVIAVILIALTFDFTNGFHDAANAIATIVATKAMTLKQALVMSAILNILGAFFATAVAETIQKGIIRNVEDPINSQLIVLSALLGAIAWNVLTWWFGMPSSSSHAIVGGLVGAGVAYHGRSEIIWINVYEKVIIPMIASPLLGLVVSALIMIVINKALKKLKKNFRHHLLTRLQIFSGALMAFSHGSNDAQKTMGIITLSLISAKLIPEQGNQIPWWVILLCAVTMGLGTLAGGKKIIVTASEKITKLENESGLSANLAAAFVNLLCSRLGIPISTTHVVVGSITGSGAISNKGIIDFSTWRHMILTWILTLPGSSGIALIIYLIFARFLLPRLH